MGQKVNPHGLRVGVIKDWDAKWYADKKNFADNLVEDDKIRKDEMYKAIKMIRREICIQVDDILTQMNAFLVDEEQAHSNNKEMVDVLNDIDEKYKLLSKDARIDYGMIAKLAARQDKQPFGLKPFIHMINPLTNEPCTRRFSFRISSILQAMQLSGSDEYDDGFNDEDV